MPDKRRQRNLSPRTIVSQRDVDEISLLKLPDVDDQIDQLVATQVAYEQLKNDLVYFNGVYIEPKTISSIRIESSSFHRTISLTTDAGNFHWSFHLDSAEAGETKANAIFRDIVNKMYGDL